MIPKCIGWLFCECFCFLNFVNLYILVAFFSCSSDVELSSKCDFNVTIGLFGDPCPGIYKYLEVTYECVDNLGKNVYKCCDVFENQSDLRKLCRVTVAFATFVCCVKLLYIINQLDSSRPNQ